MPASFDSDDLSGGLVAKERAGDNQAALSITEISALLKRTVEDRFGFVRVRGELSGVKRAASGHLYLSLKDEGARLDGVMWKGNVARLGFRPEDGLEVIATGKLTTYPGRSNYQIVIDRMEMAGEGALLALLAKTKARLEAEGLFDAARKRRLPYLPRVIGVVTSPTGAVIRDILHRLADRFPSHVVLWPVLVQGQGAAEQVAAAVRGFSALAPGGPVPRPDVLIVGRGGGSIEDLWAFNEEVVVRAIAECSIPVISAVGHETDTTLADFAADMRAPTPTAAAEMAVPVREELRAALGELGLRQRRAVVRPLALGRERLEARARRLPTPEVLIAARAQALDDAAERLRRALADSARAAAARLQGAERGLSLPLLSARLASAGERLNAAGARLERGLEACARQSSARLDKVAVRLSLPLLAARLDQGRQRLAAQRLVPGLLTTRLAEGRRHLAAAQRVMASLNPDNVLKRGYARITAPDGTTLTTRAAAAGTPLLTLHFHDGTLQATPVGTPAAPPRAAPRPARKPDSAAPPPQQDDLFG